LKILQKKMACFLLFNRYEKTHRDKFDSVLRFFLEKKDSKPFLPSPGSPVSRATEQLLRPPRPLVPITHPGVRKLQAALAKRELRRRLGIRLSGKDGRSGISQGYQGRAPHYADEGACAVLGSFGGIDCLLSSLLTAAGGRRAMASREELAHRLEMVFPLFLRILGLQKGMDLELPDRRNFTKNWGKRILWKLMFRRSFGKLEEDKERVLTFSESLYPWALEEARERIIL
jgi:hypothetical protein